MHKQKQRLQSQKAMAMRQMPPPTTNPPQQAGQKRKTLTTSISRSDMQGAPTNPMHKRSKTLGCNSSEVSGLRASSSPAASPRSDARSSRPPQAAWQARDHPSSPAPATTPASRATSSSDDTRTRLRSLRSLVSTLPAAACQPGASRLVSTLRTFQALALSMSASPVPDPALPRTTKRYQRQ